MTNVEVVAKQGELLLVRRNGEGAVYNTLTDELSEWLDLQIWFKFGVYEEIDPYPFEGAIEKGGPGSGHHGHGGRPGQRGGSASVGGAVAFGRGATELRQANAVKVLGRLPRSHTAHIKEIEFLTYDELRSKRGGAVATAMGNHHADEGGSEIELKIAPQGEAFAGDLSSPTQQSMLTHEVGHSVHSLINPSGYGLDGSDARLVKSAKRAFGSEDRSALSSRVDSLYGSKDRQALNDYAEASTAEYFSESYSHYVHFPQVLRSRDPAMHTFMRDEIFGE